jgi:hypothetical protein
MEYNQKQIVLALATAIGAFGGFPTPPTPISNLFKNEMVQWSLVFILIWQGGGSQDVKLSAIITIGIYVVIKMMNSNNQKILN